MKEVLDSAVVVERYPAYKDSGVEWLGEVPEHWEVTELKLIAGFINRGTTPNYVESSPYRVINQATFSRGFFDVDNAKFTAETKESATKNKGKVVKGDILLASTGGGVLGKVAYFDLNDSNYFADSHVTVIRFDNRTFISKYFYYFFSIHYRLINGVLAQGSTNQTELQRSWLCNFRLPVPTTSEQGLIVGFLDHRTALIDKAISIKEKQIALLKERRQILVHKAVTKGLNPDVPTKDSGVEWIGEIPEHWEVKRLKYILKSQGRIGFKGYTTSDLVDQNEGALTLGASHLDWDGNINLIEPVYISWKKYYESPEIMVSRNDIIIVQRGSTCGKVALIQDDLGPTTINPSLVLLKQISGDSEYIFYGIKVVLSGILNLVSNTAIPMLSQFQINNIAIAVPPRREQQLIVSALKHRARKIDGAISIKEQEIQKLKEYKATLINSAVTGKIKIT